MATKTAAALPLRTDSSIVPHKKKSLISQIITQKYILLMLLPAVIHTFIFRYLPLSGWTMAFTNYRIGKSIFAGEFIGLKNFKRLFFESSDLGYLLRNTLVINFTDLFLGIILALIFTILLNEFFWKGGAKVVQSVSFFPYFVSWIIAYSVMNALFAVNSGAINQTLVSLGIVNQGINILGDPKYSWPLIIGITMWKTVGYNSVIYLAALNGIPPEQYEAAEIDGATRMQKIKYVTMPNLIPTASILLIMNSGRLLNNSLDQFFAFTNATNWETMEVIDMYIYKFGLRMLDYQYATAVGMVKTLVSLIMLLTVNKIVKTLNESSLF